MPARIIYALFGISALTVLPLSAGVRKFHCKAVDPRSNKVIFTCSGTEIRSGNEVLSAEIIYRLPNRKLFAREKIDFRKDKTSPDVAFIDERDGRREKTEKTTDGYNLTIQAHRFAAPELIKLTYLHAERAALTVPGLPQYVEQHWQDFLGGDRQVFFCVFPLQKKILRLRARLDKKIMYRKAEAVLIRMQPDNFMSRWFSQPVYLTILKKSRRLVRYQGLHYIRDSQTGGGSIVDLTFEW